jgi:hypothetical protein
MNPDEPASIPCGRRRADEWRTFLDRRLSASFERRVVIVPPHDARRVDADPWHDAIVIVDRGELELECANGVRARFGGGAVLWLCGREPRVLRNRGDEPIVLIAIARRRDAADRLADRTR